MARPAPLPQLRFSVGTDTDEFWATLTDDRARSLLVIQNLDALLAQRRREAQK